MTPRDQGAPPEVEVSEKTRGLLASAIHAARTAGPFYCSNRAEETGLQNAKRKLLKHIAELEQVADRPDDWETMVPDATGRLLDFIAQREAAPPTTQETGK